MTAIGIDVQRVDGPAKVSGSAQYTGDVALPGMLFAKVLRSSYPHARLVRVDASRAAHMPGVVVLTRDDLQDMDPFYGPVVRDQAIVAIDKVRFVGDVVAAVAAEERELAEEALELIEVEYEPLPPVFDPVEAMQAEAPLLHERSSAAVHLGGRAVHLEQRSNVCARYHVAQGDIDAGFIDADEVFEDTYTTPMIQHGHIEPHISTAYWEASGKLVVYTANQSPSETQAHLAALFGVPETQVRVIVPYVGGGYGAKIYLRTEPIAAALARKAGRPVQWALTREEVFLTVVRHAAVVRIKTGVKRDGTLLARRVESIFDTGAYADIGPRTMKKGGYCASGPYRIEHQDLTAYCVYTNKPSAGAFRGFGIPQVCWAYEQQMDDIARRLDVDSVELRLKNLVREGDTFVTGETLASVGVVDCLKRVAEAIGWGGGEGVLRQAQDERGGPLKRGKGVAAMIKSTVTPSNSAASVRMNADGSVMLLTSSVEIGQGNTTALAQIVAETLGVPLERVSVSLPDTDFTPYDHGTLSSRTIFFGGNAARGAALQVREQALEVAAERLEASIEDLEIEAGVVRVKGAPDRGMTLPEVFKAKFGTQVGSIFGNYDFQTSGGLDLVTGKGKASDFWFFSAAAAEVEVDTETGKVRVVRAVTAVDVGQPISPRQCGLQNEGSMLTALGSALFEELVFDNGQPINGTFLDYMLPSMEDAPVLFQSLLVQTPHAQGPFGAKGIGEAALGPVAPAIGNAVANALGGVRFKDLPLRPDRVLNALRQETEGVEYVQPLIDSAAQSVTSASR